MTTDHCDSCLHDGAHGSMDEKQTNTHARTHKLHKQDKKCFELFHFWKDESPTSTNKSTQWKKYIF